MRREASRRRRSGVGYDCRSVIDSFLAGNEASIDEPDKCEFLYDVSKSTNFGWVDLGDKDWRFAARDGSERKCDTDAVREALSGTTVLLDEADDEDEEEGTEDNGVAELSDAEDGARRAAGFDRTIGVLPAVTGAVWATEWSCNGGAAKASIAATGRFSSFATANDFG